MNSTTTFQKPPWWWWNNQSPPFKDNTEGIQLLEDKTTIHNNNTFPHLTKTQLVLVSLFITLVLLILIIVIIYTCCCHNRRRKPKEEEEEKTTIATITNINNTTTTTVNDNSQTHLLLYHLQQADKNPSTIHMTINPSDSTLLFVPVTRSTSRFQEHF